MMLLLWLKGVTAWKLICRRSGNSFWPLMSNEEGTAKIPLDKLACLIAFLADGPPDQCLRSAVPLDIQGSVGVFPLDLGPLVRPALPLLGYNRAAPNTWRRLKPSGTCCGSSRQSARRW